MKARKRQRKSMSAIYDYWERLVAAVLKRDQIWQLCHADSDSTTTSTQSDSDSSDFNLSFSSHPDEDIDFNNTLPERPRRVQTRSTPDQWKPRRTMTADLNQAEWLEEYTPGVYVRLAAHSGEVLGVSFSREFDEQEAIAWWLENRDEVYKEYTDRARDRVDPAILSYNFGRPPSNNSNDPTLETLPSASFDFESPKPKAFQTLAGISIDDFSPDKQKNDLVFFKGSPYTFSLNELLMASSYVLGEEVEMFSRTFVVSPTKDVKVVVKRFKIDERIPTEMSEKLAKILGMVQNKNVAKLRGYYLSKRAMIGVYDYFHEHSVHLMLHGNGSEDHQARVNWETRVDIATGAAHGLAHMHKQYSNKFVMHGNIKASNVFLNSEGFGCFGDLISVDFKISGYDPPDKDFSQAFDVYNFGILLIELLSGRSPMHYTGGHKTFADWARYEAHCEWTALVFDTSILEDDRVMKEALEMLEIALSCLKRKPEDRPNMNQVMEMLHILRCEVPLRFFRSHEKFLTEGENRGNPSDETNIVLSSNTKSNESKERQKKSMSAIYDNWERLVAAVLKRDEIWQLFHADSESSEFTLSPIIETDFDEILESANLDGPNLEYSSPHTIERVMRYEPGVYVTVRDHTFLERVRFSKRIFKPHEAEAWWVKNQHKVYERYCNRLIH